MANQLILGRALDANGYVMAGAKATVYAAGTSTLIAVYSDVDGTVAAANPIEADGNGFWPQRYVTEAAKAVVTDAADVSIYTLDPAPTTLGVGAAASEVSFNPTVDVPFNNVQAAIEGVAASVVSGVSAFGIGITGNAPLLAALDATNIAAGVYRFDGTTTGTYPTGVAAADLGLVEMWRQTATVGIMELFHQTTNRRFKRRLTSGTWGAWREVIEVNIGATRGDIIRRGASDWERLALANGQAPRGNGTDTVASGLGYTWLGATQATTSGTQFDFTGVPAWATEIVIAFFAVSLSGTDSLRVQIGDSGGFETTGYTGSTVASDASNISTAAASTAGFGVPLGLAVNAATGLMFLLKPFEDNTWISSANVSRGAQHAFSAQVKQLSDVLTQVRITRDGSNTFDGGVVRVGYR